MLSRWLQRAALDRPEARAWALYDWANSAFWTTVVTAVFPIYYLELASELDADTAQQRFTQATTLALLVSALIAPFLGTVADFRAQKKRLLALFAWLGAGATLALFWAQPGDWRYALTCFALANVGAAASMAFYDALLPHVARPGEMDRLSSSGFALGYAGGGLCLALSLTWMLRPQWFGLPHGEGLSPAEATLPVRLALAFVGAWWFVFTLPLLLRVSEPPRLLEADEQAGASVVRVSFQRLGETLRELRRYRQAFVMLLAALIYNDGIATIIRMAALYASGPAQLGRGVVIGTLLAIQFVGIPCAFLFGGLADRFGTKRMIAAGLGVYCLICLLAFNMTSAWHFVVLGLLVALVQGGTQALSRSLFASLIPRHKTGEFFAFYGIGEKFAGILGPVLYGASIGLVGSKGAILSIVPFFVLGAFLLLRVDVEAGRATARAAEDQVRQA